jgi:hypothetical protein
MVELTFTVWVSSLRDPQQVFDSRILLHSPAAFWHSVQKYIYKVLLQEDFQEHILVETGFLDDESPVMMDNHPDSNGRCK